MVESRIFTDKTQSKVNLVTYISRKSRINTIRSPNNPYEDLGILAVMGILTNRGLTG